MDSSFLSELDRLCSMDSPMAIVTITKVKGSTPRNPGAKMVVLPDGQTFGSIGGGCGEAEVKREALYVLNTHSPKTYSLNMTSDLAEDEGMVCGGVMDVFIDYIADDDYAQKKLLKLFLQSLDSNQEPILVTVISSPDPLSLPLGNKGFFSYSDQMANTQAANLLNVTPEIMEFIKANVTQTRSERKTLCFAIPIQEHSDASQFIEVLCEYPPIQPSLVILGGGHIALPLATVAKVIGYQVTLVDDRPSFANIARFPSADKVICDSFANALDQITLTPSSFVVIITRGHRHDKVCLSRVINRFPKYIGMIGSRRRVQALIASLAEEGFHKEQLDKVHTPIGLDIGAETPEEIAISILAEIINVDRGGKAQSLKLSPIK